MISLDDYLMGREEQYPLSIELEDNAVEMVRRLGLLEDAWGSPLILTSGYRPNAINSVTPLAVQGDAHSRCQAADLHDANQELSKWLLANLNILSTIELWMESPISAINHVHVQSYAPKSGNRVFIA